MTRNIPAKAPVTQEMPYLLESSEFVVWITQQKQQAARTVEDLDVEIARLDAEIAARIRRRNDLVNIVARADAALALTVPETDPVVDQEGSDNG